MNTAKGLSASDLYEALSYRLTGILLLLCAMAPLLYILTIFFYGLIGVDASDTALIKVFAAKTAIPTGIEEDIVMIAAALYAILWQTGIVLYLLIVLLCFSAVLIARRQAGIPLLVIAFSLVVLSGYMQWGVEAPGWLRFAIWLGGLLSMAAAVLLYLLKPTTPMSVAAATLDSNTLVVPANTDDDTRSYAASDVYADMASPPHTAHFAVETQPKRSFKASFDAVITHIKQAFDQRTGDLDLKRLLQPKATQPKRLPPRQWRGSGKFVEANETSRAKFSQSTWHTHALQRMHSVRMRLYTWQRRYVQSVDWLDWMLLVLAVLSILGLISVIVLAHRI